MIRAGTCRGGCKTRDLLTEADKVVSVQRPSRQGGGRGFIEVSELGVTAVSLSHSPSISLALL